MTAPRRAMKPEGPSTRVVVALIVAALLALGGGAAWLLGPGRGEGSAAPGSSSEQSAEGTTQTTDDGTAAQQLLDCRAQVEKVETVIDAATIGIDHWRRHVQAQTDRFDGRIDETRMRAEFSETKLAGPEDVRRYDAAIAAKTGDAAACVPPQAASADVAGQLDACHRRAEVLEGGLRQADITMNDWKKHLADMQRSATGHVPHAQDVWLETWRKAPPNLQAWSETQQTIAAAPAC